MYKAMCITARVDAGKEHVSLVCHAETVNTDSLFLALRLEIKIDRVYFDPIQQLLYS